MSRFLRLATGTLVGAYLSIGAFTGTFNLFCAPAFAEPVDEKFREADVLLRESLEAGDKTKLDRAAAIIDEQISAKDVNQKDLADEVQTVAQLFQSSDQPTKSLEWWRKLLKLEPENWRGWAKIIQCAQALGDVKERDAARLKVLSLNKEGKVDQKLFCIEQFKQGEHQVFVMEYFTPDTKLGVEIVFQFYLLSDPEMQVRRYTLGELKVDTEVARYEKTIGPEDHLYSIDGFNKEGQWLVRMFKNKPSYEDTKKAILEDMAKAPNSTGTGMKYQKKKE